MASGEAGGESGMASGEVGKRRGRVFPRRRLVQARRGFRLLEKPLSWALQIAVAALLLWLVADIGWRDIVSELPVHPLFYLLFVLSFMALPFTEHVAYNLRLSIPPGLSIRLFLLKRVYNRTLFGYSGEIALYLLLSKHLKASKKELFEHIRDQNILSAMASMAVASALLVLLIFSGPLTLQALPSLWFIAGGLAGLAIVAGGLYPLIKQHGHRLYATPLKASGQIMALHSVRMLVLIAIQIGMWHVVLPDVELSWWFLLAGLQLIVSRIPFLPNKELLFISAGLGLSPMAAISQAGLAGVLLVQLLLERLGDVLVFVWHTLRRQA